MAYRKRRKRHRNKNKLAKHKKLTQLGRVCLFLEILWLRGIPLTWKNIYQYGGKRVGAQFDNVLPRLKGWGVVISTDRGHYELVRENSSFCHPIKESLI